MLCFGKWGRVTAAAVAPAPSWRAVVSANLSARGACSMRADPIRVVDADFSLASPRLQPMPAIRFARQK